MGMSNPLIFLFIIFSSSSSLLLSFVIFCFCFFFRCDFFFSRYDFYFLINLGECFFFFFFFHFFFCFNRESFLNKGIWVNLYKYIFSIISPFHSQLKKKKKKKREIKIFLSPHFFTFQPFSILSFFHPSNQIDNLITTNFETKFYP